MAVLPSWNALLNCGLYGLEQYLVWALVETRRLAILENKQKIVRLTLSSQELKVDRKNFLNLKKDEAVLKIEVNLLYDSQIALKNGLNFLPAIQNISKETALLPQYRCSQETAVYMREAINQISSASFRIDSLEKFLYWLLISWRISKDLSSGGANEIGIPYFDRIETSKYTFFDEGEGIVKFSLFVPLHYKTLLENNIVCAAYPSPDRSAINYRFPQLRTNSYVAGEQSNSSSNSSSVNNNSEVIRLNNSFYLNNNNYLSN